MAIELIPQPLVAANCTQAKTWLSAIDAQHGITSLPRDEETPISCAAGRPKRKLPVPSGKTAWENLATRALSSYLSTVGAAVWPEIEATICELGWVHYNLDSSIPVNRNPDPLHLSVARTRLVDSGALVELPAILNRRTVSAWADAAALAARGRKTEVERLASAKRRLYRKFLSWSGDNRLCGGVAESLVGSVLDSLRGITVWLPRDMRVGDVRSLLGRPLLVGGSLDAAGHWVLDPANPAVGALPFAVEVKNTRSTVYPWDYEVWDTIAKVAAFPEVLPVLVARRIHAITFRFFKDVGALGTSMGRQWFASSIPVSDFKNVVRSLSLYDCQQAPDPIAPDPRLLKFFAETVYTPPGTLLTEQATKWSEAAPMVARYVELRDDGLDASERRRLWFDFALEMFDEGLVVRGGWGPTPTPKPELPLNYYE